MHTVVGEGGNSCTFQTKFNPSRTDSPWGGSLGWEIECCCLVFEIVLCFIIHKRAAQDELYEFVIFKILKMTLKYIDSEYSHRIWFRP